MDIKHLASKLTPIKIHPDQAFLDPRNPRFYGEDDISIAEGVDPFDPKLQERIRAYIYEKFDIRDLMDSIQQVGFLAMDRIVVRKENDKYIVLEGNRRLTAIKTLLAQVEKKEITLTEEVGQTISEIEVLLLDLPDGDYKQATWLLQGLRHISGIKDWGPYQQAELVHTLMLEHDLSFAEAGKAIGAGRKKTGQMFRAYKGLSQMKADLTYGDKADPKLFSHFEQAWAKNQLREWLEWDEDAKSFKNTNALNHFYRWITEDNPVTNQPKLKAQEVRDKLSLVIQNENARRKFIGDELSLEAAYGVALVEETGYTNWHAPVKNATENIKKIPWSYVLTDDDVKLLNGLVATINTFFEKTKTEK